eukprot:6290117-Pyramimonas_sp.AAC.1
MPSGLCPHFHSRIGAAPRYRSHLLLHPCASAMPPNLSASVQWVGMAARAAAGSRTPSWASRSCHS